MADEITRPDHYTHLGIECDELIVRAVDDPKSWYEGNIWKYIYRWKKKGRIKDIRKIHEYSGRLVKYLEKTESRRGGSGSHV